MSTLSVSSKWHPKPLEVVGVLLMILGLGFLETIWIYWILNLPVHGPGKTQSGAWTTFGGVHGGALIIIGFILWLCAVA